MEVSSVIILNVKWEKTFYASMMYQYMYKCTSSCNCGIGFKDMVTKIKS